MKRLVLVFGSGVRRDIGRCASEYGDLPTRINEEASKLCFTQHPSQGNLRELALAFRVAAAYVGMHSRKPNFLYILLSVARLTK